MEFTVRQATHQISTSTRGKGLYNITREIRPWVIKQKLSTGLLTIFIPHTSASIVITQATSIPGDATVLVTAQDGTTTKTYKVSFFI